MANYYIRKLLPLCICTALTFSSGITCSDNLTNSDPEPLLKVDSISSNIFNPPDTIMFYGKFQSESPVEIYYNDLRGKVLNQSDTNIQSVIPSGAVSGTITIEAGNVVSYPPVPYYINADDAFPSQLAATKEVEVSLSGYMTIITYFRSFDYISHDTVQQYNTIKIGSTDYGAQIEWSGTSFSCDFDSVYLMDRCTLSVSINGQLSHFSDSILGLSASYKDGYDSDGIKTDLKDLIVNNIGLNSTGVEIIYSISGPEVEGCVDSVLSFYHHWSIMFREDSIYVDGIDYDNQDYPPELKIMFSQ
jgi:hypothetical protein